jgi:hypothetical protein
MTAAAESAPTAAPAPAARSHSFARSPISGCRCLKSKNLGCSTKIKGDAAVGGPRRRWNGPTDYSTLCFPFLRISRSVGTTNLSTALGHPPTFVALHRDSSRQHELGSCESRSSILRSC